MGYNALLKMREKNAAEYGIADSVFIPPLPETRRAYGREALRFLRENCEDLKFDPSRADLADSDGRSAAPGQIPFNMERDIDRLCLETAVGRFLASGAREDAFDIYYCFCEIFRPFGSGHDRQDLLLELLGEHESNAGSLLMKHRDHYSHSVYVFLIGLAMYRNLPALRAAFNARCGLPDGPAAACRFLEIWGVAALFHDVGYPFEIAHQQMKTYVCTLDPAGNGEDDFAPYVSFRGMERFAATRLGDLNDFFARAVSERLGAYLGRVGADRRALETWLAAELRDRAVHADADAKDYLYLDHAYFSGLILAKSFIARNGGIGDFGAVPAEITDAFCAVILHNSLFKFTIRGFLGTGEPLRLADGQPLAYLLMLCDELQCWDRASYGQNSRGGIFASDFDLAFCGGTMRWHYYYDETYADKVRAAKSYRDMQPDGYRKRSGAVRNGRCKFVDDIDEIVSLADLAPDFQPDVGAPDPSHIVETHIEEKKKRTGLYLSEGSYLNLCDFAMVLHGSRTGAKTDAERQRSFEEQSLEYRLSGIARIKGLASHLENVGCFYTDRAVDYAPVTDFDKLTQEPGHEGDIEKIAVSEHARWCAEKLGMGWRFGEAHVNAVTLPDGRRKNDAVMRERTRLHHDLVPYGALDEEEQRKDIEPLKHLLGLFRDFDGLTIYRIR